MTIWRLPIACWITGAANTQSEYVILTAFPQRHWLQERISVLLLLHIKHKSNHQALRDCDSVALLLLPVGQK
jgi:hypothetical protein